MKKKQKLFSQLGMAQLPIIIGLLILGIALPAATKLVQRTQETRREAAVNRSRWRCKYKESSIKDYCEEHDYWVVGWTYLNDASDPSTGENCVETEDGKWIGLACERYCIDDGGCLETGRPCCSTTTHPDTACDLDVRCGPGLGLLTPTPTRIPGFKDCRAECEHTSECKSGLVCEPGHDVTKVCWGSSCESEPTQPPTCTPYTCCALGLAYDGNCNCNVINNNCSAVVPPASTLTPTSAAECDGSGTFGLCTDLDCCPGLTEEVEGAGYCMCVEPGLTPEPSPEPSPEPELSPEPTLKPAPQCPVNKRAEDISYNSAKAVWDYKWCGKMYVRYRVKGTSSWTTVAGSCEPDHAYYEFSNLSPETTYEWKLKPCRGSGSPCNGNCGIKEFTTSAAPEKPKNLQAVKDEFNGNIKFSWDPVQGADHYAIRVNDYSVTWTGNCQAPDLCADVTTNEYYYQLPRTAGSYNYGWWVHAVYPDDWSGPTQGPVVEVDVLACESPDYCTAPLYCNDVDLGVRDCAAGMMCCSSTAPTPTPTITPIPTAIPTLPPGVTPTVTPTPDTTCDCQGSSRTQRQGGDYNCDDKVTLSDLTLWINCRFWNNGTDASCNYNCRDDEGEYTTWWRNFQAN